VLFVEVDWAEDHHDVCVMTAGTMLERRRVPDNVTGIVEIHGIVAKHAVEDGRMVVGIEIDRGLLVWSPLAAATRTPSIRWRRRAVGTDTPPGERSQAPGDANVLAERGAHRPAQPPPDHR